MAQPIGPEADEFLLNVQKATAGPPWNVKSPIVVGLYITYYYYHCDIYYRTEHSNGNQSSFCNFILLFIYAVCGFSLKYLFNRKVKKQCTCKL